MSTSSQTTNTGTAAEGTINQSFTNHNETDNTCTSTTGTATVFTGPQIERLQQQIRYFKNLGSTFKQSDIPKQLETFLKNEQVTSSTTLAAQPVPAATASQVSHSQQAAQSVQPNNQQLLQQQAYLQQMAANKIPPPTQVASSNKVLPSQPQRTSAPTAMTGPGQLQKNKSKAMTKKQEEQNAKKSVTGSEANSQPVPTLSWQCVDAVLSYEPTTNTKHTPKLNIGCFLKSAGVPFVITEPCISELRERLLKYSLTNSSAINTNKNSTSSHAERRLLHTQRIIRAQLVQKYLQNAGVMGNAATMDSAPNLHPPLGGGYNSFYSELSPIRSHYRTRRHQARDQKFFEVDARKRRTEIDREYKKRVHEFSRALMSHREEFNRFHRNKRTEYTKIAKLAKAYLDGLEAKREKDEARAERERLLALEKDDMEAYMKLVQETKNSRLKHLLNETETYLNTINRLVQEQRDSIENSTETRMISLVGEAENSVTTTRKIYNSSIHRRVEDVQQPKMLKGGTLKEYQLSGLQWLVSLYNNNLNGILADEMGLGKTIQTISLMTYLMEKKHNNGPFLVVVPLSTISNWLNEFGRWAPDIVTVVYKGSPDNRRKAFREQIEPGLFNVLITTYEYIMKDKSSLKRIEWQYIVVDEGHRMKNAQSKFSQVLGSVYTSRNRILLTGTPLQNNLPELWSLLNFLLPKIFNSVDTFDQWFNKPFSSFRNTNPQQSLDGDESGDFLNQEERILIVHRLHEVLRPFVLRRVKSQVLSQLPEKVEKVLRCNLSGWQLRMYQAIVAKGLASKEKDGPGGGLNNIIMQLRKVCNHPFLFLRHYFIDELLIRCSGKFSLLDRMLPKLKANDHRVLIFSQMVETMNILEEFFQLRGYKYLRLDGSTSAEEREKRVALYNEPESPYFIFLLSTRAGGLGINLATADTVIIFDSDWNPSMDAQAQDRAHRIGQKKEVRVFRILTNTPVEERILSRATDKSNLTNLVVDAGGFNARASAGSKKSDEEMMATLLNELSTGGPTGNASTENPEEQDYDASVSVEEIERMEDDHINEMMSSDADELRIYQQMDVEYKKRRIEHWNYLHQAIAAANGVIPPLPPRLMLASEHPIWLNEDCWPTKYVTLMKEMMKGLKGKKRRSMNGVPHAAPAALGSHANNKEHGELASDEAESDADKGKPLSRTRKRKDVIYDDHMTERQFTRLVEKQEDEAYAALQEERQVKRRKSKVRTITGTVYKDILDLIAAMKKIKLEDGSMLTYLFAEKPPEDIYPEYYTLIARPISLKDISSQLKNVGYDYLEEIELDFALMSHNARTFNTSESAVFALSEMVRREFYKLLRPIREKYELEPSAPYVTEYEDTCQDMPLLPHDDHLIFGTAAQYTAALDKPLADGAEVENPDEHSPSDKKPRKRGRPKKRRDSDNGNDGDNPYSRPTKRRRNSMMEEQGTNGDAGDDDNAPAERDNDGHDDAEEQPLFLNLSMPKKRGRKPKHSVGT